MNIIKTTQSSITNFGFAASLRFNVLRMCLNHCEKKKGAIASRCLLTVHRIQSICVVAVQPSLKIVHMSAEHTAGLTRLRAGVVRAIADQLRCILTIFTPLWRLSRPISHVSPLSIRPHSDGKVEFHGLWTAICKTVDTWLRLPPISWRFRPRSAAQGPTQKHKSRSQSHGKSRLLPSRQRFDEQVLCRSVCLDQGVDNHGQHRLPERGLSMIAKAGNVVFKTCARAQTQPVFSIFCSPRSCVATTMAKCPSRSLNPAGYLPCCASMTYNIEIENGRGVPW